MVARKRKAVRKKVKFGFGRLVSPDARDERFRLKKVLAGQPSGKRVWKSTWIGDQGATPHCVGFAWSGWLNCQPIRQFLNPDGIYAYAQHVDQWDGEDYEGTSVRAGAKVLEDLGFIGQYRWGRTTDEVVGTILTLGPVVLGTDWYQRMMEPDSDGFIHPAGAVVGGHAYLAYGCDTKKGLLYLKNSWGPQWGDNGSALLALDNLQGLLDEAGEACIGVEQRPR